MMPEASDPYDEMTTITLTWTEVSDGAFKTDAVLYHRDKELDFLNDEDKLFTDSNEATLKKLLVTD